MEGKTVKTSLNIDAELWKEIKKMAIDEDLSATELIEKYMSKTIKAIQKQKTKGE